jgi:hypothetical protein
MTNVGLPPRLPAVNLGGTYPTMKVYAPTLGTGATQTLSHVDSVPLVLSDHALIVQVPAATKPQKAPARAHK